MTLNRWKVLACTLTVGVGGLAVFATPPSGTKADPAKDPAPLPPMTVKPASPVNGDDTPAPILPVKAEEPAKPAKTEELEFSVPLPPVPVLPPMKAPPVAEPANLPVFEPVTPPPAPMPVPMLLLPVAGEEPKVTAPKPSPTKPAVVDTVPPIPLPGIPKPDVKLLPLPQAPKAPMVDKVVPLPETPKAPMVDFDSPPPPRTPAPPVPPTNLLPPPTTPSVPDSPAVPPRATKAPVADAKLKMLLRIGDGQPRFEIRNSATTELLLKVYGEKIEMAAPPEGRPTVAGVMAIGRVKFTAPGIEGTCDHLTILSGTGEVLLKGNIHLKTKYGKSWSEMTAEKMVYQIGTNGLSAPTRPTVTPASYIPD